MADPLHIHNARIWTGEFSRPWARSVTIINERVAELDGPPPASARVIDAGGRIITPGLIDAHMHLLRGGQALSQLDLSQIKSPEQFQTAISRRHTQLTDDQWLIGYGWTQDNWPSREMPDKSWLAGAGNRPAVCYRMDMHACVVNDAALHLVAARHDLLRDPSGGQIMRDSATGDPSGVMIEAAAWELVNPLIPMPDEAARRRHLIAGMQHCNALGITGVASMEYVRDVDEVFLPSRDDLTLRVRITLLDRGWPMEFSYGGDFPSDDRLAVIGYKAFIDGTLGSRTARMLHEYADDPGNRGMLVELAANGRLLEWARGVAGAGLSASMHAIGDEAVRIALKVVDSLDPARRPRIEHAQQIDLADIPRFRGRIASMQALHKADDCRSVRQRLKEDRLTGTFPFRRLKDAGAILAFGSDWPVVSCDPLLGIRTAVTGLTFDGEIFGADQNLAVDEAFRAYTIDAAYALGMDNAGMLAPGKFGDLVMFDRDPFAANWSNDMPRVVLTVMGGEVVYDAKNETRQARVQFG